MEYHPDVVSHLPPYMMDQYTGGQNRVAQHWTANQILHATRFASLKHTNQRRKNAEQTPYIEHPIGVASILAECGVAGEDAKELYILIAALLHDTIADTDTTWEELEAQFSAETVNYVREVTDDKSLPKDERKRLQVEHAKTASKGAKLIKMADKLHNLQSFFESVPVGWSPRRIQGYFVWSKVVTDNCYNYSKDTDKEFGAMYELYKRLEEVYSSEFTFTDGIAYPCIPTNVNLEEVLDEYYADMSVADQECPCHGGQSCIVARRKVGDFVHEDSMFKAAGIPLRKNCAEPLSEAQLKVMKPYL